MGRKIINDEYFYDLGIYSSEDIAFAKRKPNGIDGKFGEYYREFGAYEIL